MSIEIKHHFSYQSHEFGIEDKIKTTIRLFSGGLSLFIKDEFEVPIYVSIYGWPCIKNPLGVKNAFDAVKMQDPVLSMIDSNITIIVDDIGFGFVPAEYFDPSEIASYLMHDVDTELMKREKLVYDSQNGVIGVFLMQKEFVDSVESVKKNITVVSYFNALLKYTNRITENVKLYDVFLSFSDSYFNILIKKNNQLIFANRYEYRTKEDFIYFLISALQNIGIRNIDVSIHLIGDIEPKAPLHEILSKFFTEVQFEKSIHDFSWDYHRYCVEQNY